jgi:NAD kinase
VVVRADARLEVSNVSPQPVSLTIDGLWSRDLAPGDAIDVRKTERPLRMFHPQDGFFAVLRSKLAWGERHETPVAPGPMIR